LDHNFILIVIFFYCFFIVKYGYEHLGA